MAKKQKTSAGQAYWQGFVIVIGFTGAVFAYRLVSMLFDRIFPPLPAEQNQPKGLS